MLLGHRRPYCAYDSNSRVRTTLIVFTYLRLLLRDADYTYSSLLFVFFVVKGRLESIFGFLRIRTLDRVYYHENLTMSIFDLGRSVVYKNSASWSPENAIIPLTITEFLFA